MKMVEHHCPKCEGTEGKVVEYMDVECVVCNTCGVDERNEVGKAASEQTSQKAKGNYSKYKVGGSDRVQK